MRVPLSWLRAFVDLPIAPEALAERLTMAGLEVSAIDYVGVEPPAGSPWAPDLQGPEPPRYIPWDPARVVVGEIVEVQPHPNADRLSVPTVSYGDGRTISVVTGAPNIKVGMRGQKVALALAGARLIDGHSATRRWLTLKPTKLRGVPSEGMVCSELELGLSDEHEGILFLPDDAPVGVPLRDYLGDVVLEIDILPNMARALSIIGVAREVAALLGQPLRLPEPHVVAEGPPIAGRAQVSVENAEDCPRFAVGLIEGVTVGPSPFWMQHRLRLAGMRPISNIVDVSNYVMLEWGQPTHAFDADKVADRHLIIRRAQPGETLRTLDNQLRTLSPEHIVVADTRGAQSLAGVMGGLDTEVTDQTRNVLLEAAIWKPSAIRRTAQAFKLPSEASRRFERGVDPELPPLALRRALELMRELAGGTVAAGLIDVYGQPYQPRRIELTTQEVRRLLGIELSAAQIADLLTPLGFECEVGVDSVLVIVPSFRQDVTFTADLAEEVARMYGYERLPQTRLADELPPQYSDAWLLGERMVRDTLVACGLTEAITYSLTGPEAIAALEGTPPDAAAYLRLANPIAPERALLRQSLLPELLRAVAADVREREQVRLFEVGRVYLPRPGEPLPDEPRRLAIVLAGRREPLSWHAAEAPLLDYFDLKGVLETLFERLGLREQVRFLPSDDARFHPGRAATLVTQAGRRLGLAGELHPDTRERLDIELRRVVAAELDLDALLELRAPARYRVIARQPAVDQDIAVIAPQHVAAEQIRALIRETAGPLLERLELFDVYEGAPIPAGQRSLAFRLWFRAPDRTLSDADVNKIRERIARRLQSDLGATIRA
ncbi:phenylalanine--tRNA ligase subunit beta [Kallotenue papyrolyticum]|uniref:phenylalanine--tRNA ligase subunit beta n=1 Tax=Kallotenue papyrolyticum TaxID=1325125 RepID=UPI0004786797|nr:phenylalanine--tRNA ligase subunit beta [Kallotenue papyrolyticum]